MRDGPISVVSQPVVEDAIDLVDPKANHLVRLSHA